jgi:hypothetical protein
MTRRRSCRQKPARSLPRQIVRWDSSLFPGDAVAADGVPYHRDMHGGNLCRTRARRGCSPEVTLCHRAMRSLARRSATTQRSPSKRVIELASTSFCVVLRFAGRRVLSVNRQLVVVPPMIVVTQSPPACPGEVVAHQPCASAAARGRVPPRCQGMRRAAGCWRSSGASIAVSVGHRTAAQSGANSTDRALLFRARVRSRPSKGDP